MPASKLPRPTRRAARWTDTTGYEVTEAAQINSLPNEPLDIAITPAGKGEYLPTKGKFKEGEDARRHKFTREECQKGYQNAINSLLRRFPGCDPHFLMCAIVGTTPWHKLPEIQYLMQRDEPLTNAEALRLFARS